MVGFNDNSFEINILELNQYYLLAKRTKGWV